MTEYQAASAFPVRNAQRLLIHTFNGKRCYGLVPPGGFTKAGLGGYAIHELKDGLETESLDELIRLFTGSKADKQDEKKRRAWETDPKLRLEMINRLAAIIQQSTEKGEVDNSKALYERLTGRQWTGPTRT